MSFIKWLDKNFEYFCLAVFLVIMTVLSFVNVIMRYFFHNALSWSDEVCCYCLALSSFFCLSCSIRHRNAIRVDTFTAMLPQKAQKALNYLCDGIMIVFMILCVKGGLDVAANAAEINQKSPALQVPVAWFYYVMTFCFALGIVRCIQCIIQDIRGVKEEEE